MYVKHIMYNITLQLCLWNLVSYKLFFFYVFNIGSTNRICIIENEIDEDLNKPIFRNTGDVVSVSKFY